MRFLRRREEGRMARHRLLPTMLSKSMMFLLALLVVAGDASGKLRCKFQRLKDTWIDFKQGFDVGARRFESYKHCERWCCQVAKCRHYSFNHDKYCYLRSSDPQTVGKQEDEGVISGIKSSVHREEGGGGKHTASTANETPHRIPKEDLEAEPAFEQAKYSPSPHRRQEGFCSSLDGPYCSPINGLEPPPEVQCHYVLEEHFYARQR
jgi:hypothetical protein